MRKLKKLRSVVLRIDSVFYPYNVSDMLRLGGRTVYFSPNFGLIIPNRPFAILDKEKILHSVVELDKEWAVCASLKYNTVSLKLSKEEYDYERFEEDRVVLALLDCTPDMKFAIITEIKDHEEDMIERLLR